MSRLSPRAAEFAAAFYCVDSGAFEVSSDGHVYLRSCPAWGLDQRLYVGTVAGVEAAAIRHAQSRLDALRSELREAFK